VKEHKFHRGVIYEGDVLEVLRTLESGSVNTIITSPPYWGLRDYQAEGQIGLEPTLEEYLDRLLNVAAELKRVLRDDGVMFWNHGDSYGGSNGVGYKQTIEEKNRAIGGREGNVSVKKTRRIKEAVPAKSMVMQNYRLAMRMVDEQGWILRNILVWHKVNHMPSSVRDRFTNAYEPVFFFVKNQKYWSDLDAVRVPHKATSIERAKRGVGSNHKYANLPHYGGGGGINKPRPNIKHDITVGRMGNFSYDDPLPSGPLHPLGKNPGDVWSLTMEPLPEAHFAHFPTKLINPMVKFGCPKWICKRCGVPRSRDTKKGIFVQTGGKRKKDTPSLSQKQKEEGTGYHLRSTTGWSDCGCSAGWQPGTVLDPFMGSGTTALVAAQHGCNFIGIELNPEYIEIAKRRIGNVANTKSLEEFV